MLQSCPEYTDPTVHNNEADYSLFFIRTKFIRTSSLTFWPNIRTNSSVVKKDRNGTKLRTFAQICICSNFKKLRTIEPYPIFTGSYKK